MYVHNGGDGASGIAAKSNSWPADRECPRLANEAVFLEYAGKVALMN